MEFTLLKFTLLKFTLTQCGPDGTAATAAVQCR